MLLIMNRPISANGALEPTAEEGGFVDPDEQPKRYYINVETVGSLEADVCFQQGIKVLQHKIGSLIHELSGTSASGYGATNGVNDEYVPRSPDMMETGGGQGNDGRMSSWGGHTTYGGDRTTYGNGGGNYTQYGGAMTSYGNQRESWQ
jgi:DNA-directed RNA polymerase II subunit RPB3